MNRTIDIRNLPAPSDQELSTDTDMPVVAAAHTAAMVNYYAAVNSITEGGEPLVDLAGSYLTKAGILQVLTRAKEQQAGL